MDKLLAELAHRIAEAEMRTTLLSDRITACSRSGLDVPEEERQLLWKAMDTLMALRQRQAALRDTLADRSSPDW